MEDKVQDNKLGDSRLPAPVPSRVPATIVKDTIENEKNETGVAQLRIVPARNAVLFPHNIMPLTANREWSPELIEKLVRQGATIGVVATREGAEVESILSSDLYTVGTQAKILKLVKFPDQSYGAVLQGLKRFRISRYVKDNANDLVAEVEFFDEVEAATGIQYMALARGLKQLVQKAISLSMNLPSEASLFIENVQDPIYLSDLVVPYLSIEMAQKQEILEIEDAEERLRRVHVLLTREIEILEVSQKIHSEVRNEVSKQQRKYYVREQLKMLQKELGELDGREPAADGGMAGDAVDLKTKIEQKIGMSQEAKSAALREVSRMQSMHPSSPEFNVSSTYVNWLIDLPWGVYTQKPVDLSVARKILDADHYGLEKVKKRIGQFLAVYSLKNSLKGPILLLVGPPGVGKTSLGKSVAKSLGRKFVRIALGGVRDEAEMRGHRRTYVGALPGKFVDALKKAGSMDPVILLDEIDKVAGDFRGDPASALLEVLDSEQNNTFTDHYLNIPLDLSRVLFIATANTLQTIPGPLRDRMEVVELSGYTLQEKTHIASNHLWPQVLEGHGLADKVDAKLHVDAMKNLIQGYTREAGVRELNRQLAGVARGLATDLIENGYVHVKAPSAQPVNESTAKQKKQEQAEKARKPKRIQKNIGSLDLKQFLGSPVYSETRKIDVLPVGVATGLAYTPVGGDVLFIESVASEKGTGKLSLTGQLGDVMKESVQTALAYISAHASHFELQTDMLRSRDVHVHFPAGAVRKDGPSAGVAVLLSLIGLFSNRKLPSDLAMTGEISLRGDVLPVGGIKEKLIAAHRYGVKTILLPFENEKDLEDLPPDVLKGLKIHLVKSMPEAVHIAFGLPLVSEQMGVIKPKAAVRLKSKKTISKRVKPKAQVKSKSRRR